MYWIRDLDKLHWMHVTCIKASKIGWGGDATLVSETGTMIGLVAFADNRFKGSLERLRVQAQRMGAFDLISINSESEIPPDYLKRHQDRLTPACRGFGYWCWKPLFALRELQRTPDLEILIYCDAGCHLWPGGRRRLDAYIRNLRHSPHDFLGFQMFNIERQWTKADLFAHHDIPLTHPHASSGQIWGGCGWSRTPNPSGNSSKSGLL